jgi:hypothetical protein
MTSRIETPDLLSQATYPLVEDLMVTQNPRHSIVAPYRIPRSFTDQIAQIAPQDPDAYLVTAYSAVPVADAIRGYHDTLGLDPPYIGYIMANRRLSRAWVLQHHMSREALQAPYEDRNPLDVIDDEIGRLRVQLAGMNRVSVVEQYVNKRQTLYLAHSILRKAGITQTVSFEYSNWYHHAERFGMDLEGVTSSHAAFMRQIGNKAAIRQMEDEAIG